MKRWIPSLALALAMLAVCAVRPSDARVSVGINLRIGSPLPFAVYEEQPDVVVVPGTRVYYAEDVPYDMFRYGSSWYVCNEGTWYWSRSYRGPFVSVAFDNVPGPIVACAPRYVRHQEYGRSWGGMRGRGYGGGYYGRGDGWNRHWDGDNWRWSRDRGERRGDWNRDRGDDNRGGWNRDRGDDRRGHDGDRRDGDRRDGDQHSWHRDGGHDRGGDRDDD